MIVSTTYLSGSNVAFASIKHSLSHIVIRNWWCSDLLYHKIATFLPQVHFRFTDAGPDFDMPPPCSVVIQVRTNELFANYFPIYMKYEE